MGPGKGATAGARAPRAAPGERPTARRGRLAGIPRSLWRLAKLAPHRLLMLDYDGTLAPFRTERSQAVPLPGSLELLKLIARCRHSSLAIVSGRPVRELTALLGPLRAALVGEHGWETRGAAGAFVRHPLSPEVRAALDAAVRAAGEQGLAGRLERKRTSVVLHTRGVPARMADEMVRRCRELWQGRVLPGRMRLVDTNGGVELRATTWDKGKATLALIEQTPPGCVAVYVGDDLTDEDAFHAVQEFGFGIRVGTDDRPTLATGRLGTPEDVGEFLERWLAALEEPPVSRRA